jgi:hypothetical protein
MMAAGAALLLAGPCRAQEAPGQIGVGLQVGIPFGLTAKYLLDGRNALALAFGAQGKNVDFHCDALTHFRNLAWQPPQGRWAPTLGLGLKAEGQGQFLLGVRFSVGAAYSLPGLPLEAFAEVVPVLRLAPSVGSNLDGGAGLRYYFGSAGK